MIEMLTSEDIRNGNFTINDMKKHFEDNNIPFDDLVFNVNALSNQNENKRLKIENEQLKNENVELRNTLRKLL